ncbi:MAG: DUF4091 domain-containing protein, partial [Armatimonadetes bacterium]|nr:DUF4091 domain-containing protein [Armatimonadota bacterium]
PAGDYQGSVTVAGGGLSIEAPIRLRVYGFDLPEHSSLRTISRIWQRHDGYLDLFRQNVADHRAGGTSEIEGIKAQRDGDRVVVDASGLPDAVARNLTPYRAQVFNVPRVYLGDYSGLYAKDGKWFGFDVFTPEFDRAFGDYCRQVGDALRTAGVMPYALWQIWDEPHGELIDRCVHLAKLIKAAAPDARIYLTMAIEPRLLDYVGIWNLPWPGTWNEELAAAARRRGADLWAYENERYTLDTADSLLQMRGYLWRLRRYGIQGVEWWAISSWKSDPWTVPNQYAPQNGGGFFLYPTADRKGAPISSLRWELYREGVEDYDLLTMLRAAELKAAQSAGHPNPEQAAEAALQALVSQVALNVAEIAPDPRLPDQLKRRACERIEKLGREGK